MKKNKFIIKKIFAILLIATVLISYGNIPSFAVTDNEIAKDGEYKSDEVTVEYPDKFSYKVVSTVNVEDGKFKSVDFAHVGNLSDASARRSQKAYDYIKGVIVGKESSEKTINTIDTVTGSTISINAVKMSLKNALNKAEARPNEGSETKDDDSIFDEEGKLKDGTYSVEAETDSSMFKIPDCKIVVKDGECYAICTLASVGFDRIFMGPASDAANSANSKTIAGIEAFRSETSKQTTLWPIPVERFDYKIKMSARSARKKSWYDHTIEFKSNTIKRISKKPEFPSREQEAKKFIRQFYLDECIFDGLEKDVRRSGKSNYTVPFFKNNSTEEITGIKFRRAPSNDFMIGWDVSDWNLFSNRKKDKNQMYRKTLRIKDRSKNDNNFKATLKIYDRKAGADYSSIVLGTANPIAEATFDITLKAAPAPVFVDFTIKDIKSKNIIKNSKIKINDPAGEEVIPNEDGKYKLGVGLNYSLEVSADGYLDKDCNPVLKENLRVTESGTIEKFLLSEKDSKHLVRINVKDENKKQINNPVIEVIHDKTNQKVIPDQNGKYLLLDNQNYTCNISADGYIKKPNQRISVTDDKALEFILKENIKEYNVKIFLYSVENYSNYEGPYDLKLYSKDGENKNYVKPEADGRYKLKREVKYYYDLKVDNFIIFENEESVQPFVFNGDEENVEKRIVIQPTKKYVLKKKIDAAKELKENALASKGEGPGQFPEKDVEEFIKALDEAEKVFNDKNSTEQNYDTAASKLQKAIYKLEARRNFFVETVKVRINQTITGAPEEFELTVSGDMAKKYDFLKSSNRKKVTILDVILAVHEKLYGDDFKKNPETKFKTYEDSVVPERMFGLTSSLGFIGYNNTYAGSFCKQVVKTGDLISLGLYSKSIKEPQYLYFEEENIKAKIDDEIKIKLNKYNINSYGYEKAKPAEGYTIFLKNKDTGDKIEIPTKTDNEGIVKFNLDKAGHYELDAVYHDSLKSNILPYVNIEISEKENKENPTPGTEPTPGTDPTPGAEPTPGTDVKPETVPTPSDKNLKVVTEDINDANTEAKGNKVVYVKGESNKAVFRIMGKDLDVKDLVSVLIDGQEVDRSNYDVRKGSIIVSFKKSYVDSLKSGTHKFTFKTSKGTAKAELVIKDKGQANIVAETGKVKSTNTGDTSNFLEYALIAVLATGYIAVRKKQNIK